MAAAVANAADRHVDEPLEREAPFERLERRAHVRTSRVDVALDRPRLPVVVIAQLAPRHILEIAAVHLTRAHVG